MRIFIALAILAASGLPAAAQKPIDVFIVAGQSNAVGFDAPTSQMPADDVDQTILFRYRIGDPPPDAHDSVSDGWVHLQAQPLGDPIKPRRDRQYGNFGQPEGGFGPEIGFARQIAKQQKRPIAILKVAFSGTHVEGDWDPKLTADTPTTSRDCSGACYRHLVQEHKTAMAELVAKGFQPNTVAMVWVQGESDANAARASRYQTNLTEMIASLRTEIESPNMIALLGVNTKFGGGKNKGMPAIIAAQKAIAESDKNAAYVDTDGASIANNAHFDAAGTIDVGKQFAERLMDTSVTINVAK